MFSGFDMTYGSWVSSVTCRGSDPGPSGTGMTAKHARVLRYVPPLPLESNGVPIRTSIHASREEEKRKKEPRFSLSLRLAVEPRFGHDITRAAFKE